MPTVRIAQSQLRRAEGSSQRATNLELFYDLVFVFAITQVSHHLLAHLSWTGAAQSAVLLLAVWWSWNYTTWATNELDPDAHAVRALVVMVMFGSLMMAISLPDAFAGRATVFAGAYVAIQVGRHAFLAFAAAAPRSLERVRASRILAYFILSAPLWVAGALADEQARLLWWALALALELSGPLTTFWLPGVGRADSTAWTVRSTHFAERFSLFVIIALGESIVVIGTTAADLPLDAGHLFALIAAFLGAVAIWWLYFDHAADAAEHYLEAADASRTMMARDAYTYLHALMVAAIILCAVGNEIVIAGPAHHLDLTHALPLCAGPGAYLLAQALFQRRMSGAFPLATLVLAACCAIPLLAVTHLRAQDVSLYLLVVLWVAVVVQSKPGGTLSHA